MLIRWQIGRRLQCRRFQGVDLDPVCVVLDQCASADRLVVLHTRRTMTTANDSGNQFLWTESKICYALSSPEREIGIRSFDTFTASCMLEAVRTLKLRLFSRHARGITVFALHKNRSRYMDHELCKVEVNRRGLALGLQLKEATRLSRPLPFLPSLAWDVIPRGPRLPLYPCFIIPPSIIGRHCW